MKRRLLSSLEFSLFAEAEDRGRAVLVTLLSNSIRECGGTLPPPKVRGLGAEILALMQALIVSPGTGGAGGAGAAGAGGAGAGKGGVGYVPLTCMKYHSLLTVAGAVVEAMQRSSGKQMQQQLSVVLGSEQWQCAYDTRASREMRLHSKLVALALNGSVGGGVVDGGLSSCLASLLIGGAAAKSTLGQQQQHRNIHFRFAMMPHPPATPIRHKNST